jgi:hypothetical protein
MRPVETIATLASCRARGAGTDAERRAAKDLIRALESDPVSRNRMTSIETFWCRPNWALAHAWHVALGLAGSLVAETEPRVGVALIATALLSLLADATTGLSLGRRLTPERASQNVVSESGHDDADTATVRLIVTANYDAGRTGLAYRDPIRRTFARLRHATGRLAPGWLGWLAIAFVWLLVIAALRLNGHKGTSIGVAQLLPTVGLVLALALLLELAVARFGPAANDNASGAAAAIALVRALSTASPRRLAVDLLLQGAGDGGAIGLGHYLRARGRERRAANTVVLAFAPCGNGRLRWWSTDGPLVPLGFFGQLRQLSADIARDEPHLRAASHRGRGSTPALPARARRLPAIAIGCLDEFGLPPRSHQAGDTPAAIDSAAIDQTVEFGLLLVDAIDEFIARRSPSALTPAAA